MKVMWAVGRAPGEVSRARGEAPHALGGWQDALLALVASERDLELLVVHPGPQAGERLAVDGVTFICAGPTEPRGRMARVAQRWGSDRSTPALLEACAAIGREWGPDLVHLHGTECVLGPAVPRIGSPWIVSMQGVLTEIEKVVRSAGADTVYGPGSLSARVRGVSPAKTAGRLFAAAETERTLLAQADHVAGRTAFDREAAGALAPRARYHKVGEVLRPEFRGPRWTPRARPDGGMRMLAVGANPYLKGLDVAVEAAAQARFGGRDVTLRIAGLSAAAGPGRRLMALAAGLEVEERVTLVGEVDAPRMVEELLATDVYVAPTRADNSPNALCEAMMLGVPCVATAVGGIPSLATHGEDAILVSAGDPQALAKAILGPASDGDTVARMSIAASARASQRHDPDAVRAQLLEAYESAAAG